MILRILSFLALIYALGFALFSVALGNPAPVDSRETQAIVVLTGRDAVFSAGFDLNVMKRGGANALRMLRAGYGLPARILGYPHPH